MFQFWIRLVFNSGCSSVCLFNVQTYEDLFAIIVAANAAFIRSIL